MSNFDSNPTLAQPTPTKPTSPLPIPTSSKSATSPPLDPSKLNQTLAPLPPLPTHPSSSQSSEGPSEPVVPLRSPESGAHDSAYLDTGLAESPSHPTVAETGLLSSSIGGGPKSGQLKRNEGGAKGEKEIIRLGSLGGEGLIKKPPVGSPSKELPGGQR